MIHFLNWYKFIFFILLFGTKYLSRNIYSSFSERICVLFLGYSSLFTTTETGLRSTQHRTEWTQHGCFSGGEAAHSLLTADIWSRQALVDMFSCNDVLCFFCSTKCTWRKNSDNIWSYLCIFKVKCLAEVLRNKAVDTLVEDWFASFQNYTLNSSLKLRTKN